MIHPFLFDEWSPRELPNLRLWLSAKKAARRLGAGLGVSTTITTLPEFSGRGFSFTQATADSKPVLAYDGTTYYITSDGTDDILVRSSNDISSAQMGYVCVAVERITAFDTAARIFIASADEAVGTRYGFCGITTAGRIHCGMRNADTEDTVRVSDAGTLVAVDTPYIFEWYSDSAATAIAINGVTEPLTVSSGTNTGRWFGDAAGRDNFSFAALKRNSEGSFASANICDVIVCDSVPTAAQRATLRQYLNRENDLRIAL